LLVWFTTRPQGSALPDHLVAQRAEQHAGLERGASLITFHRQLFSYWAAQCARFSHLSRTPIATLFRGVAAAVVGIVVSRFFALVANSWIAHRMDIASYGHYGALLAALGMIGGLAGLGFDTWILQEGTQRKTALIQLVWDTLVIKTFAIISILVLSFLFWSNHTIFENQAFYIGLIFISFESIAQTGYAALRVKRRNGLIAIMQIISPLLLLMLLWFLRTKYLTVPLLFGVQALSSLVPLILLWYILHPSHEQEHIHIFQIPFYVLKGGWIFVVADVLATIYAQVPIAILALSIGDTAVGIYKPAFNVITMTYIIPHMMFVVGLPIIGSPKIDRSKQYTLLIAIIACAIVYGLIAMQGIYIAGESILLALHGTQYARSTSLLYGMALIPLFKALNFAWSILITARNKQSRRVVAQAIVTVIALITGWVLIPTYGLAGAIWLTVLIEVLLFAGYTVITASILLHDKHTPSPSLTQ
jgi:O-antigen/teichoic acid export membrane protein